MITTAETKQGYQKTKLGLIPLDWEVVKSGTVLRYLGGATFKSKDSVSVGIKWLKIANVGISKIKWDVNSFLPSSYRDKYAQYLLGEDDIVLALTRPILNNKLKIAKLIRSDAPALLNQRVAKLEVKKDIDILFAYQFMQLPYFIHSMNGSMAGTDPPNIGINGLNNILIPLPPLPEQKKIAQILSTWDTAITKTKALIQKKQELKKGLMQVLLTGKVRFEEFVEEEGVKKSKLGLIPKDWEVKRFGKIGSFIGGGTPSTSNSKYWKGNIPWLSSSDIIDGNIHQIDLRKYITKKALEGSAAKVIPAKSLLMVSRVGVGKLAINKVELCTSQDFCNFIPLECDVYYIGFYLILRKNVLINFSQGTSIKGFTTKDIKELKIPFPSLLEQKKIAKVLNTCDQGIEKLNEQLAQLQAQKKGLMQQLLTGATRVKVEA